LSRMHKNYKNINKRLYSIINIFMLLKMDKEIHLTNIRLNTKAQIIR
jgi:hypothetical protein